jgi:hypothetical protein
LVLFAGEVVFVFTEPIAWIHYGIVGERDCGWVADAEVYSGNGVAGRFGSEFVFTHDVQLPASLMRLPDSADLLDVL